MSRCGYFLRTKRIMINSNGIRFDEWSTDLLLRELSFIDYKRTENEDFANKVDLVGWNIHGFWSRSRLFKIRGHGKILLQTLIVIICMI